MSEKKIELPSIVPPGVHLYFLPEIHSDLKEHRSLLRLELRKKLAASGTPEGDLRKLSDLTKLPTLTNGWVSLSHSPLGSALLISENQGPVGVDLEVKARLNQRLVERVSSKEELNQAPKGFDLFTAKESAWKALNQKAGMPTISHIETHKWSQLAPKLFRYYVKDSTGELPGYGIGFEFSDVYLSFYLSP